MLCLDALGTLKCKLSHEIKVSAFLANCSYERKHITKYLAGFRTEMDFGIAMSCNDVYKSA